MYPWSVGGREACSRGERAQMRGPAEQGRARPVCGGAVGRGWVGLCAVGAGLTLLSLPQGTFSLIIQAWHAPDNYLPEGEYRARRRQGAPPRRERARARPASPPSQAAPPGSAVYTITPGPALSHHQEPVPQRYPSGAALILPRPNLQHNCVSSGLFLAWESEEGCGEKAGSLPASPVRLFLYFTPCSNSALWKGIMALGCFSERRGKGYFTAALLSQAPRLSPFGPSSHALVATFLYPCIHQNPHACLCIHTYVYVCMYICVYVYMYVYMCIYMRERGVPLRWPGGAGRGGPRAADPRPLSRRLPAAPGGVAHQPGVDPAVAVGGRGLVAGRASGPADPAALLVPRGLQRELLRRELLPPLQAPRRSLRTLRVRGGREPGLPARLGRRVLH